MAELSELYFVKVGPEGTFRRSGQRPANPAHIDALLRHLEDQGVRRVAIHFHGGLVSEHAGLTTAANIRDLYEPAGIHPVTVVWETGFFETLTKNLHDLDKTTLFGRLLELALRYAAGSMGIAEGKGPGQPLTPAEVKAERLKEEPFASYDAAPDGTPADACGGLTAAGPQELRLRGAIETELAMQIRKDPGLPKVLLTEAQQMPLLDPKLRQAVEDPAAKGILNTVLLAKAVANVVIRVVKRRRANRDHGFYPTVVEEVLREIAVPSDFGQWMWGGMKRTAEHMWNSNEGLKDDERHAGTYFLDGLIALQQKRPELTVDLIGHSAGAIAICYLLRANAKRLEPLRVRNVVFLAPACTANLFRQEVVAAPERFRRFRMFTMHDDFESRDRLVPGLYTRSLLYFISGVLEEEADTPLAGMERFLRGEAPYNTEELLPLCQYVNVKTENRLVLSLTTGRTPVALEGLRSDAANHSAFDDESLTGLSLKTMFLEDLKEDSPDANQ